MFPYTSEGIKTAVDQVRRTVRQMTYFLSSRATSRRVSFWVGKISGKDVEYAYVDIPTENADYLKGVKGFATYSEIKTWVKDTYGMTVSSLYVAQIKDKFGFEKRLNYNLGAEGHRVPKCPPEKEKAIVAAFKHFRMIE